MPSNFTCTIKLRLQYICTLRKYVCNWSPAMCQYMHDHESHTNQLIDNRLSTCLPSSWIPFLHTQCIIDVFSFIYVHGSILSSHNTKKMSWFGSLLGPLRSECCWSLFPPSSCLKCTKRSRIIPMYCMIISLSHIAQVCISLLIFIPESGHDSSYPYSNTFTSFHWPTLYMIW